MTKLILTALLIMLIVVAGGLNLKNAITVKKQFQEAEGSEKAEKNTLKWYAAKAKREDTNSVVIPAPLVEHLGAGDNPEFVLANYSIVIARPVESKTIAVDDDKAIATWYKFKSLESIKERPPIPNLPAPTVTPPQELLPLDDDNFLIITYGGTINVDGTNVHMLNSEIPPFDKNRRYLLFISKSSSGIALTWAGPVGIFYALPDGTIEPMYKNEHPVKELLKTHLGNSVGRLKEYLAGNK